MNIKSNREELLGCLEAVKDAASSTIKPILGNVLIRVDGNAMTMIATDHEIQMTANGNLESKDTFESIVPAGKLQNVLRSLETDAVIEMRFDEKNATMSSGRSVFKLVTQKTDEFVLLGETGKLKKLEKMDGKDVLVALRKVYYASAQQSHRINLNGVLLERSEDGVHFVATDGHRLAVQRISEKKGAGETRHIIPRKTIDVLVQRLREEGEVEISANDRVVKFKTDYFELISNVIDENYPDYRNVIPRENNDKKATVERGKLQAAMRRVMALAGPRKDENVAFVFGENKLQIKTSNRDSDSLEEWMEIGYDGDKIEIGFNIQYIADVLNALDDDVLEIRMNDENSGVLIQPAGDESDAFVYVLMPIRL